MCYRYGREPAVMDRTIPYSRYKSYRLLGHMEVPSYVPLHSFRLQGNLITKLKNLQCAPINVRFPGQTRYGVGQSPTGTTERPLPELGTHLLCLAESSRQLPSSSRRPHFHLPLYPSANTSSAADRNDRSDSFAPLGLVGSNGHIRWRPINLDARQGKIYAWGAVG